ncbi:MAG TPA: glycoside hydrolase family 2 TIM barrel-domain containing protein, partial [Coriobacteriia bacterium]
SAEVRATGPAPERAQRLELSGPDKDHTVPWDFMVDGGRRASAWSTIPVPSNWELQGFGTYKYGGPAPRPDEKGRYRLRFETPRAWRGKRVDLVFEGSMTDTEAWIDGKSAGPKHQGAFYEFRYDVTALLRFGTRQQLEVLVAKESSNESVNSAERHSDFWIFGGIYRPVYLEAHPAESIERVAIDARHDGAFRMDVHLRHLAGAAAVTARIESPEGQPAGPAFSVPVDAGTGKVTLATQVGHPAAWTAESPSLYRVVVSLERAGKTVHTTTERFGFRTVELRPRDGLYVNGVKVRLKGVNRHSFWPDSGRATSRAVSEMDVKLIKNMNMNAVRMSHYPPDRHFLEVCDEQGLFVLDELTGWQHRYDTTVGHGLVRELVVRDVNHPSVIFWDNGNEGGFNYDLDADFPTHDPQKRPVIHPWQNEAGRINTTHYREYDCCAGKYLDGPELVMPTEVLHGLYDGGHGAGLYDLWSRMLQNPLAVGAFLWDLADEGIVRTDRDGALDTDGNHAPDGIVGPYREKEASFFTIKDVWSPVFLELGRLDRLPPTFDGRLRVENRYDFTDLGRVAFEWRLERFAGPEATGHADVAHGTAPSPPLAPGDRGTLVLPLPPDWRDADALSLTAKDQAGREIDTWTWMTKGPDEIRRRVVTSGGRATGQESGGQILLEAGGTRVAIDRATGRLASVERDGRHVSLANGPRIVDGTATLTSLTHGPDGGGYVVEAAYDGNLKQVRWRMDGSGWLELSYRYENPGRHAHLGVTFDYPEAQVTGLRWLGRGPFRVWKNRIQGTTFDVWQKAYNDTRTGADWTYPEFKGHHANLYWAVLQTKELPITVVADTEDLFLRVLTPRYGVDPTFTAVAFPEGDVSFLHGIAPVGTKFAGPETLGPESQLNEAVGDNPTQHMGAYAARLFFYFGESAVAPQ